MSDKAGLVDLAKVTALVHAVTGWLVGLFTMHCCLGHINNWVRASRKSAQVLGAGPGGAGL